MYGASVSQMKAACSALPQCEGFNSDGWIKSRISQKKRSTIDLYLKQVVTSEPSLLVNVYTIITETFMGENIHNFGVLGKICERVFFVLPAVGFLVYDLGIHNLKDVKLFCEVCCYNQWGYLVLR